MPARFLLRLPLEAPLRWISSGGPSTEVSAHRTSFFERLGVAFGKAMLPVFEFLWGDLSPRGKRVWSWIFWVLSWPLLWEKRRVTNANLKVAFPEKSAAERSRIARESMLHLMGLGFDWIHQLKSPHEYTRTLEIPDDYRENCSALNPDSRCQAALYCTLHLGNWEAQSRVSYVTGRPGSVVVARFKVNWFNELSERLRTAGDDTKVIPAEGAARGVLRSLLSGLNVGILIDQNVSPNDGGVFQKFFGLPVSVSRLPAVIARKLQIPVYVCSCIRHPDGICRMEYALLERNAWEYESDDALTAAIYRAYEQLIRRHPEQYLWSYRRWRSIPANASESVASRFPYYATRKKYDCPLDKMEP